MKTFLVASAINLLALSNAHAATVSCGVGKFFDNPSIEFGEISEGLNLSDFGDMGKFGLSVVINGNGKTAKFATTLKYKKVGGRIEFDGDSQIWLNQVTLDQFQSEFGLFPEASCSTP